LSYDPEKVFIFNLFLKLKEKKILIIIILSLIHDPCLFLYIRGEMDWVISMSGHRGTAERRMTVTVTDTPRVCGPSVSTVPSTMVRTRIMMRAAPALWLPPSAMVPRILTREW